MNKLNFTPAGHLYHACRQLYNDTRFDPEVMRLVRIAWLDNFQELTFKPQGTYTGEYSASIEALLRQYEERYITHCLREPAEWFDSQEADRMRTKIYHQKSRLLSLMYWAFRVSAARGEEFPLWKTDQSLRNMLRRCEKRELEWRSKPFTNG